MNRILSGFQWDHTRRGRFCLTARNNCKKCFGIVSGTRSLVLHICAQFADVGFGNSYDHKALTVATPGIRASTFKSREATIELSRGRKSPEPINARSVSTLPKAQCELCRLPVAKRHLECGPQHLRVAKRR